MASSPIPIQPPVGNQESPLHIASPHHNQRSSISPNSVYQPIECPPPRSRKYRQHRRPQHPRRPSSGYSSESESDSRKLELEPEEQQLPDSGYGTQSSLQSSASNSPKSLLSLHLNKHKPQQVVEDVRSSPLPGRDDLHIFRGTGIDPPVQVIARFREIMPEIQRMLQKHVSSQKWSSLLPGKKKKKDEVIMTMRLMIVGKTQVAARPSIVIFVSGHETKGLEILMKQNSMKELCHPNDGIVTNFDVVIVGDPARKRFLQQVDVSWEGGSSLMMSDRGTATWCGARIRFETEESSAVSTLGGLVKLTRRDGEVQVVGMTAAHVLEGLLDEDDSEAEEDEEDAENEAEEQDYRIHLQPRKPLLGHLIHPVLPFDGAKLDAPARDWALFEIDHKVKMKPNLLQRPTFPTFDQTRPSGPRQAGDELSLAPPESYPEITPIEVALISKNNPNNSAKLGFLSHLPGGLMLSPDKGFVDAYTLALDDNSQIENGDSGAWVINPISKTVYGHLISTDFTGDGYIIPLHATFDEIIATITDISTVSLPTTAELVNYALQSSSYFDLAVSRMATGSPITESPAWTTSMTGNSLRPRDRSTERRVSELFTLAYPYGSRKKDAPSDDADKRKSIFSDRDSGYGSCGSSIVCNSNHRVASDSEIEGDMANCSVW